MNVIVGMGDKALGAHPDLCQSAGIEGFADQLHGRRRQRQPLGVDIGCHRPKIAVAERSAVVQMGLVAAALPQVSQRRFGWQLHLGRQPPRGLQRPVQLLVHKGAVIMHKKGAPQLKYAAIKIGLAQAKTGRGKRKRIRQEKGDGERCLVVWPLRKKMYHTSIF